MTNKEVVRRLREKGFKIGVYIRKDGSLRITSINGKKFRANQSKGIEEARNILAITSMDIGREEAERRQAQKAQRAAARASKLSGNTLRSQSKEFQRDFIRLQRKVRALNARNAAKGKRALGSISWEQTKKYARIAGITPEEQLRRAIDYYEPLTSDVAPRQMTKNLIARLMQYEKRFPELIPLRKLLEDNIERVDVYAVDKASNWVYGYVKGIPQSMTLEEVSANLESTRH